jgi:hypothetical protein
MGGSHDVFLWCPSGSAAAPRARLAVRCCAHRIVPGKTGRKDGGLLILAMLPQAAPTRGIFVIGSSSGHCNARSGEASRI